MAVFTVSATMSFSTCQTPKPTWGMALPSCSLMLFRIWDMVLSVMRERVMLDLAQPWQAQVRWNRLYVCYKACRRGARLSRRPACRRFQGAVRDQPHRSQAHQRAGTHGLQRRAENRFAYGLHRTVCPLARWAARHDP